MERKGRYFMDSKMIMKCRTEQNLSSNEDEERAANLLAEFENQLLNGDWPDLDDYVKRYGGPNSEDFRMELQLTAVLLHAGCQRHKKIN